eukprot:gene28634-36930_t
MALDKNLEFPVVVEGGQVFTCLPHVYILGQPKCGTSDLFARITRSDDVLPGDRKEIRWFTRGEFSHGPLSRDARINEDTSIFSFADLFNRITLDVMRRP